MTFRLNQKTNENQYMCRHTHTYTHNLTEFMFLSYGTEIFSSVSRRLLLLS